METTFNKASLNCIPQHSAQVAFPGAGGQTSKYLDGCTEQRCCASVDLPQATPARRKTTLFCCNKTSSFPMVLFRGMNTSVSKLAGSSASGISRLPLLTLFISIDSIAVYFTSRSTRSAFRPDTFKPFSRSFVFSFLTVNFSRLALVVSLPEPGTARVCEPLIGRCKKHSATIAIATNSLKRD